MFEFQSHLKPGKLVAGAYNRPRQAENDQLLFLLRNRYPCYWELPTTYAHEAATECCTSIHILFVLCADISRGLLCVQPKHKRKGVNFLPIKAP
jgi:hypothetical protein